MINKQAFLVIVYLPAIICSFFSCNQKTPESKAEINSKQVIKSCLKNKDTIINTNCFVKYIAGDTSYKLQIGIGGIDTLLGHEFGCGIPNGLVPILNSYHGNTICLKRGYSQHFREFIICTLVDNKIKISTYEIALLSDLSNNRVFYRDYYDLNKIIIENYITGEKKIIPVPDKYYTLEIINTEINGDKLILQFYGGESLQIVI